MVLTCREMAASTASSHKEPEKETSSNIDISWFNTDDKRAELLQTLQHRAMQAPYGGSTMCLSEAKKLLDTYMDYVRGRCMKMTVPSVAKGNKLNGSLYDRDAHMTALATVRELRGDSRTIVAYLW